MNAATTGLTRGNSWTGAPFGVVGEHLADATGLPSNPDADPSAPRARIARQAVNGTTLYAEIRGTGPAILLIPGGAEDAEGWRPVAERPADNVQTHLEARPNDWAGAYEALMRIVAPAIDARGDRILDTPAANWYARREAANGEAMVRDDVPILTAEGIDEAALAAVPIDIRFAHGTESPPLFREIATRLASVRGDVPDAIGGAGHALYVHPAAAAAYISDHTG